jgi:SAM-dependent methyltransferase
MLVEADMRQLPFGMACFDAITCLWQSFGYFSAPVNADILRQLWRTTRPGGLLLLDLYHRGFFAARPADSTVLRNDQAIRQRLTLRGSRLRVELQYPNLELRDTFDWQIFTPKEFANFARPCGWRVHMACADFDTTLAASPAVPRVQYVLGRATP